MRRTLAIVAFILASIVLVWVSRRPAPPFDWTEALGFTTGVLCVWMTAVEDVWNFPVGILNSAIYIVVFYRSTLYADFGLSVAYVGLGFQGWYLWLRGGERKTELPVAHADRVDGWQTFAVMAAGLPLWLLLKKVHGFAPFLDALLTALSVTAQLMLNRKRIENWLVWIAADAAYVGLYAYKGLKLTAVLYAVYFMLATLGYFNWRKDLRGREVAPA